MYRGVGISIPDISSGGRFVCERRITSVVRQLQLVGRVIMQSITAQPACWATDEATSLTQFLRLAASMSCLPVFVTVTNNRIMSVITGLTRFSVCGLQSINQSINQSVNQSVNQSINQSINLYLYIYLY